MKLISTLALLAAGALAVPAATSAATIYASNFGTGLGSFATAGGAIRTDGGVTYLGNLTQGATATITISTAGYSNVSLDFDLYGVLSLDGNGPSGGGADPFLVTANAGTIFNYTFANYNGGNAQSYGGAGNPAGSYAPRTGEASCDGLGFGCGDFGDAEYHFTGLTLTPIGNSVTLTFTGNSNQGIGDEFYGINNVVVSGTSSASGTPEPATWALMIGGFGLVGGALRRRSVVLA